MPENPASYLDLYNRIIAPKLREIDLFVKERRYPITIWEAAQALDLSGSEIESILRQNGIERLGYESIFTLIMHGSSDICKLIQRELERNSPTYYSPQDLSFIYGLDLKKVESIFVKLGINRTAADNIAAVFEMLPAKKD